VLDAFGVPQSVIVLGATSDIGEAILSRVIERGARTVVLAARDAGALRSARDRARAAGATDVHEVLFDALDVDDAGGAVARCFDAAGGSADMVLVAVGVLGDQERDEGDPGRVADVATVDFTWPAAALAAVSERMRAQGTGRVVILSSVAGVRVRRANYVYGAAKAGLDGYAVGLSEALRGSGVRVHVVRPGFVRTKMTAGRPDAPLPTSPEQVATDVIRGIELGQTVIWSPSVLRWVFGVFRLLPQFVWRRLPG
jgi:decaprenylphospho-beta-D-erythro-pentofuranosid-2-ulose 2-reductase